MDAAVNRSLVRYISMMDANTGGASRLVNKLQAWIPEAIQQRYQKLKTPLTDSTYIDVAVSLAESLMGDADRVIVREVLHARVEPRLSKVARDLDPAGLASAITSVHAASDNIVGFGPYGANDVDRMAMRLTRIGLDVIKNGAPPEPRPEPNAAQARPAAGKSNFPEVSEVKSKELPGSPIGTRKRLLDADKPRVLPGFSTVDAILLNGLAPEIDGGTNLPVVLECKPKWIGPGRSTVIMPRLRVGGTAKPVPGPSRISIELNKLIYTFENGHTIEKPFQGFVCDNVEGKAGLLAEWHSNWEKILPPALASSFLAGTGKALDQTGQTVQVNAGGTTTVADTNQGTTLERAVIGGASEGAKTVGDYFKQFMDKVKPTVEAPNGQPVTVVSFSTVTFEEITEAEWQSATNPRGGAGF